MRLLIWFFVSIVSVVWATINVSLTSSSPLRAHRRNWLQLSKLTHDHRRDRLMHQLLDQARGIYANGTKAIELGLNKSVLVTLVTFEATEDSSNNDYLLYLRNWICFVRHHNLKGIVYTLDTTDKFEGPEEPALKHRRNQFRHKVKDIIGTEYHRRIFQVSFPESMFWSVVAKKAAKIVTKGHPPRASYTGLRPSFKSFGALPMLMPMLEVLQWNHSVLFLDLDMGLVQDPIPWLVKGHADISFSKEIRDCQLPSFAPRSHLASRGLDADGNQVEPNTGVAYLRHSDRSLAFVTAWIQRVVDLNYKNDQKAIDLSLLPAHYSDSCNSGQPVPSVAVTSATATAAAASDPAATAAVAAAQLRHASYCLYNEYVIQNGMVALRCARNFNDGERPEYVVGMQDSPMHGPDPVILHVNYAGSKLAELESFGLLLIDPNEVISGATGQTCKRLDASDHHRTWPQEVETARRHMEAVMTQLPPNGTLFMFPGEENAQMIFDGVRRQFPNRQSFDQLGLNWSTIVILGTPMYRRVIPKGPEMPSIV